MGAGNADAVVRQHPRDFGDHSGPVGDVETDIIRGGSFSHRQNPAAFAIRQEAAVAGNLLQRAGRFHEVRHDGRRGGILTGTATVEKRFAGGVAMHRDGIEDTLDGG